MYAIKNPEGKLLVETTSTNRKDAWNLAYRIYLSRQAKYRRSFYHVKLAHKHGWRSVKVKVTEL